MSEKKDKKTLLQKIVDFFDKNIRFLLEVLSEESARDAIYRDLGIPPSEEPEGDFLKSIGEKWKEEKDKTDNGELSGIELYQSTKNPDREALERAIEDLKRTYAIINDVMESIEDEAFTEEQADHVLKLLSTNYIRMKYPVLYWMAQPLGFFADTVTIYSPGVSYLERFKSLSELLPLDSLGELQTEDQARNLSHIIFAPLSSALAFGGQKLVSQFPDDPDKIKFDLVYGWDPVIPLDFSPEENPTISNADTISKRTLSLATTYTTPTEEGELEATIKSSMCWVPTEHGGPGLLISLGEGISEQKFPLGEGWQLSLSKSSDVAMSFLLGPDPVIDGPLDAKIKVVVERPPSGDTRRNAWPDEEGTRLEFERLALEIEVSEKDASIKAIAKNSTLFITDKFFTTWFKSLVPSGGFKIDFDLGLGLSMKNGLFLEGGTNLTVNKPITKSFGPVTLSNFIMSLAAGDINGSTGLKFSASNMITVSMWGASITIDQAGFEIDITGGRIGHTPPKGVGIKLDCDAIKGGGYLFYDKTNEQYAGILQVSLPGSGISLTAVGLITSKLADGKSGFSLFISISAEGMSWPIGFGFNVTGIGGMVGINRSVNTEFLRKGIKSHKLDSVLFPKDPLVNIGKIVSNLREAFPATRDRFLIGIVAKISWGTSDMLTMQLGIIVELPTPVRLVILGQILLNLPSKKKDTIRIKMDSIGVIDFGKGTLAIDASLYGSKLGKFPVTGDMVLRANWKGEPWFVYSIGGFNPGFPATGLPKVARLALKVANSKNKKLVLQMYNAITSNTYQIGIKADFYFKKSSFNVSGYLGADGFLEFRTRSFSLNFYGEVNLKWKSHTLAGISLEMTIEGPGVWYAYGKATFKIWRWSKSVSFDVSYGDELPVVVTETDVLSELLLALRDTGSWSSELNPQHENIASLIEMDAGTTKVIHPLSDVSVRQQVVPLGIEISRFGNAVPSGDRLFTIDDVEFSDNDDPITQSIDEYFAPGQYLELDESSVFNRPSFDKMQAGIRIGSNSVLYGGLEDETALVDFDMEYEEKIISEENKIPPSGRGIFTLPVSEMKNHAFSSAAGKSINASKTGRYRVRSKTIISTASNFIVVGTDDLSPDASVLVGRRHASVNFTEASQALEKHLKENPHKKGKLQIIKRPIMMGALL